MLYFCTLKIVRGDNVAQLVEHCPFKAGVLGSNPSIVTASKNRIA